MKAAFVLAAAVAVAVVPLPASASVDSPLDQVQSDSATSGSGEMTAVVAISPTDVWAAGYIGRRSGGYEPVMRHWDGKRWSDVAIAGIDGYFQEMSAAGPDDIWVVGENSGGHSTAAHWDGKSWTPIETPDEPGEYVGMRSLVAISSTNVIATGYYCLSGEPPCYDFTLRWNGKRWYDVPEVGPGIHTFTAVSPSDAWGFGAKDGHAIAKHWDGASWHRVRLGRAGANVSVTSASAVSSDDVWAAGAKRDDAGHIAGTFTMHWDGKSWTRVRDAVHDVGQESLSALAASSPNNVWAIGNNTGNSTLIERWDGHRWQVVPNPTDDDTDTQLRSVASLGPNDVWVVGRQDPDGDSPDTELTMHWDGSTWTVF